MHLLPVPTTSECLRGIVTEIHTKLAQGNGRRIRPRLTTCYKSYMKAVIDGDFLSFSYFHVAVLCQNGID